jgi:uncharacterized protein YxjI
MSAITLCRCGASYEVRDEFAGQRFRCPTCGTDIVAGHAATRPQADPAFDRDRFHFRQKHLSINQKYYVDDDFGQPLLFVERPSHVLRGLAALTAGIVTLVVSAAGVVTLAGALPEGTAAGVTVAVGLLMSVALCFAVAIALSAKRHLTFYRDDTKREPLLRIFQDRKFQPVTITYTVADREGKQLARLSSNRLVGVIRKRWYCDAPEGTRLVVVREDSILLSLLRRWLGPLFGALRTNFILLDPAGKLIGEFNRKLTIRDRYLLTVEADRARTLDRRLALAIGVMLDTGERR